MDWVNTILYRSRSINGSTSKDFITLIQSNVEGSVCTAWCTTIVTFQFLGNSDAAVCFFFVGDGNIVSCIVYAQGDRCFRTRYRIVKGIINRNTICINFLDSVLAVWEVGEGQGFISFDCINAASSPNRSRSVCNSSRCYDTVTLIQSNVEGFVCTAWCTVIVTFQFLGNSDATICFFFVGDSDISSLTRGHDCKTCTRYIILGVSRCNTIFQILCNGIGASFQIIEGNCIVCLCIIVPCQIFNGNLFAILCQLNFKDWVVCILNWFTTCILQYFVNGDAAGAWRVLYGNFTSTIICI